MPVADVDEKHQITGTFCVNILGEFLPVQLIYSDVTDRCHPKVKFPGSFHITQSSNHCSNRLYCYRLKNIVIYCYLKKRIFTYLEKKHNDLKLEKIAKESLIFDVFKGQSTSGKSVTPKE